MAGGHGYTKGLGLSAPVVAAVWGSALGSLLSQIFRFAHELLSRHCQKTNDMRLGCCGSALSYIFIYFVYVLYILL